MFFGVLLMYLSKRKLLISVISPSNEVTRVSFSGLLNALDGVIATEA